MRPIQQLFKNKAAKKSYFCEGGSAGHPCSAKIGHFAQTFKRIRRRLPFLASDVDSAFSEKSLSLGCFTAKHFLGIGRTTQGFNLFALVASDIDHVQVGTIEPLIGGETINEILVSRSRF